MQVGLRAARHDLPASLVAALDSNLRAQAAGARLDETIAELVRIRAEVIARGGREVREMTLGTPIAVSGGTLTLVDAAPPKVAPGTADPSAYRFTFHFER